MGRSTGGLELFPIVMFLTFMSVVRCWGMLDPPFPEDIQHTLIIHWLPEVKAINAMNFKKSMSYARHVFVLNLTYR